MKKKIILTLTLFVFCSFLMVAPIAAQEVETEHLNITLKEAQAITEASLIKTIKSKNNDYKHDVSIQTSVAALNGLKQSIHEPIAIEYTQNEISQTLPIYVYDSLDKLKNIGLNAVSFDATISDFQDKKTILNRGHVVIYDIATRQNITNHTEVTLKRDTYTSGLNRSVIFEVPQTTISANISVDIYDTMVGDLGIMSKAFKTQQKDIKSVDDLITHASVSVYRNGENITDRLTYSAKIPLETGLNQTIPMTINEQNEVFNLYADVFDVADSQKGISAHDFNAIIGEVKTADDILRLSDAKSFQLSENSQACKVTVDNSASLNPGINTIRLRSCDLTLDIQAGLFNTIDPQQNRGITYESAYLSDSDLKNKTLVSGSFAVKTYALNTGIETSNTYDFILPQGVGINQETQLVINGKLQNIFMMTHIYTALDRENSIGVIGNDIVAKVEDVTSKAGIVDRMNLSAYILPSNETILTRKIRIDTDKLDVGLNQKINITIAGYDTMLAINADVYNDINANQGLLAHGFNASVDEVDNVAKIQAKARADVYDLATKKPMKLNLSVTELKTKGNNQQVTISNGLLHTTVTANLFDVYDEANQEGMNAQPISLILGHVNSYTLKYLSEVEAWDTQTMTQIASRKITMVSNIPQAVGSMQTRFATERGTQINVPTTIYDNRISIAANNIAITFDEAYSLDAENVLKLMNATAVDNYSGADATSVTLVGWELINQSKIPKAQPIRLSIEARYERYTSQINVYVYVFDALNEERTIALNSNDGVTTLDVSSLSDEEILELVRAEAWDLSDINNQTITTVEDIDVIKTDATLGMIRLQARGAIRNNVIVYDTNHSNPELKSSDVYFTLDEFRSAVEDGSLNSKFVSKATLRLVGEQMIHDIIIDPWVRGYVEK
ncbi:hypothetical protein G7062_02065 [Erysipelothrix sp. HDW6C]|uniref:hypothetical protein n=1 Tax=Erysipelothrix sp. HDW6C TaxID=2714930 RepID=UPI001409C588|nr:hypothetical protein [Erysipelothrix sp. HDW6C]QIK69141.1 hypothetical protein G7062_02065 [Erysipelothrix sp. HDW6C]